MAFDATLITSGGVAISPSDTIDVSLFGFYVGGAGDVAVVTALGTPLVFASVPAGGEVHIAISRIKATGTTATSIIGYGVGGTLGVIELEDGLGAILLENGADFIQLES